MYFYVQKIKTQIFEIMEKKEKKKLTRTLNVQTAEGQELALEALNAHLRQKNAPPQYPTVLEEKTAEIENKQGEIKNLAKKFSAKTKKVAKNTENLAKTTIPRNVKRLNMDLPQDLYEKIETEITETGQTVKGFFVMLARQHFKNKN